MQNVTAGLLCLALRSVRNLRIIDGGYQRRDGVITRFFKGLLRAPASVAPESEPAQDDPVSFATPYQSTFAPGPINPDDFQHQDRFRVDFEASANGSILYERFRITQTAGYFISLAFAPSDQITASQLSDILRTKKVLINAYDEDAVDPAPVTLRKIMAVHACSMDEANVRLWEGVNDGSFVYRIVDRHGVIPLWIELTKVVEGSPQLIFSDVVEGIDVVGQIIFGDGVFGYERNVTPVILEPGLYTIEVRTVQDTPELSMARIKFGLSHGFAA